MLLPRNRRHAIVQALICTTLFATANTAASASSGHHHAAHAVRASHTRVGCAARAAKVRHAHAAAGDCRASVRKARHPRQAKPHKAPATTTVRQERNAQESPASIAAVLATPCQNTELTPEAGNIALVRAAVLCLVNQERAQNGRSPLTANPQLEQAAEGHCGELIADDYFAHVSPSGETPVQRIVATGYVPGQNVGYAIGENLAWGTLSLATPKSIVNAWIASPGHLANILESQYTETGIGVTPAVPASLGEGEPGASYAQEFGVIIR